jgi:hypothetical protein
VPRGCGGARSRPRHGPGRVLRLPAVLAARLPRRPRRTDRRSGAVRDARLVPQQRASCTGRGAGGAVA